MTGYRVDNKRMRQGQSPHKTSQVVCEFALFVRDRNAVRVNLNRGLIHAILLNDKDLGTIGRDVLAISSRSRGTLKLHSAKVAERYIYAIMLEVFDDPLSILLAKLGIGRHIFLYSLACGMVLDLDYTVCVGGRGDCNLDFVTSVYGNVVDINRVGRKPLIPS